MMYCSGFACITLLADGASGWEGGRGGEGSKVMLPLDEPVRVFYYYSFFFFFLFSSTLLPSFLLLFFYLCALWLFFACLPSCKIRVCSAVAFGD